MLAQSIKKKLSSLRRLCLTFSTDRRVKSESSQNRPKNTAGRTLWVLLHHNRKITCVDDWHILVFICIQTFKKFFDRKTSVALDFANENLREKILRHKCEMNKPAIASLYLRTHQRRLLHRKTHSPKSVFCLKVVFCTLTHLSYVVDIV